MGDMLDPTWALTRPMLWVALVALTALLVLRAIRRDRREYQRFKRYRSTAKRQAMYRKWLRDSFVTFGGLSVVLLLVGGAFVAPLLANAQSWGWLRSIRDGLGSSPVVTGAAVALVVFGFVGLTVVGISAARKEGSVITVGDIAAMLPRNRRELGLGAALSVNAGVVEELAFRLALPAALFGATGSAVAAVLGSLVLFGALHVYQGVAGVIGSALIGALFMLAYLVSGSILLPIVLHALFDLRSMVLIPVTVYRVHRVSSEPVPRPIP